MLILVKLKLVISGIKYPKIELQIFFALFSLSTVVFVEVLLIYNVLISSVQHSEPVSYIYSFIYRYILFIKFSSIIRYYKVLNIVPCAIQ